MYNLRLSETIIEHIRKWWMTSGWKTKRQGHLKLSISITMWKDKNIKNTGKQTVGLVTRLLIFWKVLPVFDCLWRFSCWEIFTTYLDSKPIPYNLFQNGRKFSILLFTCKLALVASFRGNILQNFEFKNETTRANLQENKRLLKLRPFWNKVYLPVWYNFYLFKNIPFETSSGFH